MFRGGQICELKIVALAPHESTATAPCHLYGVELRSEYSKTNNADRLDVKGIVFTRVVHKCGQTHLGIGFWVKIRKCPFQWDQFESREWYASPACHGCEAAASLLFSHSSLCWNAG